MNIENYLVSKVSESRGKKSSELRIDKSFNMMKYEKLKS